MPDRVIEVEDALTALVLDSLTSHPLSLVVEALDHLAPPPCLAGRDLIDAIRLRLTSSLLLHRRAGAGMVAAASDRLQGDLTLTANSTLCTTLLSAKTQKCSALLHMELEPSA